VPDIRGVHSAVEALDGDLVSMDAYGLSRRRDLDRPHAFLESPDLDDALRLRNEHVLLERRELLVRLELPVTVVALGGVGQDLDDELGFTMASPMLWPLLSCTVRVTSEPQTTLASA